MKKEKGKLTENKNANSVKKNAKNQKKAITKDKKRNLKKLLIIGGIILFIIGLVVYELTNIKREKLLLQKNIDNININYNQLIENANEYNKIRTELTEKLSNFYLASYEKDQDSYVETLTNYNNIIIKIDNNIKNIDSRCHVIYKDSSINRICGEYKTIYEKFINLYVNDLNNYNAKLLEYNKYKNTSLESFKMIHTDYIDYNHDKIYEGREVENNEDREKESKAQ